MDSKNSKRSLTHRVSSPGKDRFSGQVIVVTGSAQGVGKSIARAFGCEGALVAICDIDEETGRATESQFQDAGIDARFVRVDLAQSGSAQSMVQEVVRLWGRLDILVNNARSRTRTTLLGEDEATWEEGIAVNLRAAFFASQEAVRIMAKSRRGCIVNISSVASFLACGESPIYQIAKAGLAQMTRYFAVYAGNHGVRVNAVLPGFIVKDEDLPRYQAGDNHGYRTIVEFCHPMGQAGRSDDVANAVLLICSPEAAFVNGQCLVADGGLTLQEQGSLVLRLAKEADLT